MKWDCGSILSVVLGSLVLTSCDEIVVKFISPSDGQRVHTSVKVQLQVEDPGALTYLWQLDGRPISCGSVFPFGLVCPAPEGQHTLSVTAVDRSFRTGSASVRILVDEPLGLVLSSPASGQWFSSTRPPLTFSPLNATGPVRYTCQLDSTPGFSCTSPIALSELSRGPHRVTIAATDSLDTSSATAPFFVDAGDGPEPIAVKQIAAGFTHTCALLVNGKVRCWGSNGEGMLGYPGTNGYVGDNEFPSSAGDVNVGGEVTQISAGGGHTCALLTTGNVRCWGQGASGQLGYGNTETLGGSEAPASAGDVNVGGPVAQVAAGQQHTCALLKTGKVRCWGGGLGIGHPGIDAIGDNESPASAGDVDVGGTAIQIAAGFDYSCALLDTGKVRCWGAGSDGRLGYGNTNSIGDDEAPSSAGDVNVGGRVTQIAVALGTGPYADAHTCALLTTGAVRCWGIGSYGVLGYGNTNTIGDDEPPSSAGDVNVGGTVTEISVNLTHTCAVLTGGGVRCWGFAGTVDNSLFGALGYGNRDSIGDDETPASAGDIDVGDQVAHVTAGAYHVCALLTSGKVRCWGQNSSAQLGYANANNIGDDEAPASAHDVVVGY